MIRKVATLDVGNFRGVCPIIKPGDYVNTATRGKSVP